MPEEITAEDAQREANRRRDVSETYTKALMIAADIGAVTEFMSKFNQNLAQFEKDFEMHLETYPDDLGKHYKQLSGEVAHKTFMQRYFYRCCDLMRIQRELEKHGIPKTTTASASTDKMTANHSSENDSMGKKPTSSDKNGRPAVQRMNSVQKRAGRFSGRSQPQPQRANSFSSASSSSASTRQPQRANSFRRQQQPSPKLQRTHSVSKIEGGKRDSGGVRFRGGDPAKRRSAWNSAEAGQDSTSEAPPIPCERQSTRSLNPEAADASTTATETTDSSRPSSSTNQNSNKHSNKIKPALKHNNDTAPSSPTNVSQTKKRWEDKAKTSPKNESLPIPVRKISKQPHGQTSTSSSTSLLDDEEDDDKNEQQKQHMNLRSQSPAPSLKSKMNAWNKAANSNATKEATATGTATPEEEAESKQQQDPSAQSSSPSSSSPPKSRQGMPEREGSARDLIEKLESSKKNGTNDTTAAPTVRKWSSAQKPSIPKPPSKHRSLKPSVETDSQPNNDTTDNDVEEEREDSGPSLKPIKKSFKNLLQSKNKNQATPSGANTDEKSSEVETSSSNEGPNDKTTTTQPSWKAKLKRRSVPVSTTASTTATSTDDSNEEPEKEDDKKDDKTDETDEEPPQSVKPSSIFKKGGGVVGGGAKSVSINFNVVNIPQKQSSWVKEEGKDQEQASTSNSDKTKNGGASVFAALPFISVGGGSDAMIGNKRATNEGEITDDAKEDTTKTDNDSKGTSSGGTVSAAAAGWAKKYSKEMDNKAASAPPTTRNRRRGGPSSSPNRPNSSDSNKANGDDGKKKDEGDATIPQKPTWKAARLRKQQQQQEKEPRKGEAADSATTTTNDDAGEKPTNDQNAGTKSEPTPKPGEGTRVRRVRPSTYRTGSRRGLSADTSKDGGNGDAADEPAATSEHSTSHHRSSVRDRLKKWGGKSDKASSAPTDNVLKRTSSFSGRRSSRSSAGKPPAPSTAASPADDAIPDSSFSSRSGSSSSTRRSMRSKSPTGGRRGGIRSASPAVRQIDGSPSVKDRLSHWGSRKPAQEGSSSGNKKSTPDRHPPRPTRSNESLNSNVSSETINSNASSAIRRVAGNSNSATSVASDWKPDPLAVKCVVRAERRRNAEDTYTQMLDLATLDPWEDGSEFEQFLGAFDLSTLEDDIQIAFAKHKTSVGFHFKRLVPNRVSVEDFWKCYFYRCDEKRILRDLRRRENLGTLGQSMVFNASSTSFNASTTSADLNDSNRSGMDSLGDSERQNHSAMNGSSSRGFSSKNTTKNGLDSSTRANKSISDKILKADENSVMSKGSLISRLKQWDSGAKTPVQKKKTGPKDRALEKQDSDKSITIEDAMEPSENDDTGSQASLNKSDVSSMSVKSDVGRGSVKERLKNWSKSFTGVGGKDISTNSSELQPKRVPRRNLSVPTSETEKNKALLSPKSGERFPNGKSSDAPPLGSPTLRYSNRTSDKEAGNNDDEEPKSVKPSDILRRESNTNAAAVRSKTFGSSWRKAGT